MQVKAKHKAGDNQETKAKQNSKPKQNTNQNQSINHR